MAVKPIGEVCVTSVLPVASDSPDLSSASLEFRALAELIPQLVWVSRPDGKVDFTNGRWRSYVGEVGSWNSRLHPDDAEVATHRWAESVRSGTPFEAEFRLLGADGRYRWFLGRATALRDENGRIVRWFGTATDIHEQKQQQVATAFLAQASEILASSLDYEATLASITRLAVPRFADWAAVDLLSPEGSIHRVEVAHVDEEKVHLAWELFRKYPPNLNDQAGLALVLRTGKTDFTPVIPDLSTLITDPELLRIMQALQLRSSIVVPMIARGRILGAITFVMAESGRFYLPGEVTTAEDLGRRAGVAVDNARLYKESLNVSRMKDDFLSTLSHELRTPMTAIFGWAQMLDAGRYTEESLKKGLSVILRNARAQAQIIDDLLDMSRIITGKLRLEMAPTDLNDIARAAEDTLRPTADARGVKLELHPAPEPCIVNADRDRLQQVVWNLLSNAIKFTPRGGNVRLSVEPAENGYRVIVADTGHGISKEFLPHVFERFRQEDSSATRREGGLGLGLAVVKHLVDLHGGTVTAQSDGQGKGATFVVELPQHMQKEASPQTEPVLRATPNAGPSVPEQVLFGLRVLLVDDQDDARELVSEVLSLRGATVRTAANASEGLAQFLRNPPDVLVTDLGMPGEDGYQLLYKVRTLGSAATAFIPAVALTAYARPEDIQSTLRAGFQRHVPKPVDPDRLIRAVGEITGRLQPSS